MDLSFYTNFSTSLIAQENQLNTLEQEVSTGIAVQTPNQNPAAYETATIGTDQLNTLNNDTTSLADIQGQLGNVSDVYSSVSTLLDSVQSVVEQALNGTTSSDDMESMGTQVDASEQQLLGLANTTGTNGTYLFGGTRGSVQPFQQQSDGTVLYMGDGGTSQAAISSDLTASTIANGETFMTGMQGDGYATVTAGSTDGPPNTGTGVLISEGVANPTAAAAFQSGGSPITLSFASNGSGGLTYTAKQTTGTTTTTLATGPVTSGLTLTLGGSEFQLSGTPAATDTFTIAPSQPQSAFALLSSIASTLQNAGSTSTSVTNQQLNQDLSSLAQYQQTVVTAQAQTGVTLQSLTSTTTNNATQATALQTSVNNATAVNMPAALTSLNENLTAVEAAMKAFSSVQSLSLFNYISS